MDTLTPSSAPAGMPKHRRRFHGGRLLVIGVPQFWFVVFLLVPFLILLKISFSHADAVGVGSNL